MTIYVVKQGRGERRYDRSDDYEGHLEHTEWDVKVFDCKSKVVDYIYNAMNAEIDRFDNMDERCYTRRMSREKIENYQDGQAIGYAVTTIYDFNCVETAHFFTYRSYEVE